MKTNALIWSTAWLVSTIGTSSRSAATTSPTTQSISTQQIKDLGVFDFPQSQAKILCDTPDLRVSAWNNTRFLYLQAVIWADSDDSGTRQMADGRTYGDFSEVLIKVDADAKTTIDVDRTYFVNPLVSLPGLHYVIAKTKNGAITALQSDSAGRGTIRYLIRPDAPRVRVDNYLIPLDEIRRSPGDKIRLAYFALSINPKLALNSLGIPDAKTPFQLPSSKYHTFELSDRTTEFDPLDIPDDRNRE